MLLSNPLTGGADAPPLKPLGPRESWLTCTRVPREPDAPDHCTVLWKSRQLGQKNGIENQPRGVLYQDTAS